LVEAETAKPVEIVPVLQLRELTASPGTKEIRVDRSF
jgi:hypothetical protein